MSPQISEMVVKIKADTREFDRALRRVSWQFWWLRFGPTFVLAVTALVGAVIGAAAGVVLS